MNTATVSVNLPEDIATHLAIGQDLSRVILESLALEGYRDGRLSAGQVRRLLDFDTRMQVHAFLKTPGVFLHYGAEDLTRDRDAGDALSVQPAR